MPEIKLSLDDPSLALDALEVAQADARHEQDTASVTVLADLRAQIAAQLPKAPVEEPTAFGSVVRAGFDEYSDRFLWQRGPKGGWTSDDGSYHGFFGALHDPEVLRVGVGEPATSPAEAVEADEAPKLCRSVSPQFPNPMCIQRAGHPGDHGTVNKNGNPWMNWPPEPTPEQVEAEAVCNCDYVARGGPGATPERPVEHHPLCDINLPADKRSGIREQVGADLVQDEQAHARYYAQPGVPAITPTRLAAACKAYLAWPDGRPGNGESPMHAAMRCALEAALLPEEPTS